MKTHIKKNSQIGIGIAVLLSSFFVAYAALRMFYNTSITSDLAKKKIFEFELNANLQPTEIGPGDSILLEPIIHNTATESMYVFIEIETPECNGEALYEIIENEPWTMVESTSNNMVYAYGMEKLIELRPGDSTESLTSQIIMHSISNSEFAEIEDINFKITGYGIDIEGNSTNLQEVWQECKALK